jgi:alkylhydroperoxidase family enzyme
VKAHAAVAAELLGSEELVSSALEDPGKSPLKPEEKALLQFIDKVNRDSPHIGPDDIAPLHAAGWTDEAIYYAITVCALFNFYNRWVDATGVHAMSEEAHRAGGKRMALAGYVRKS